MKFLHAVGWSFSLIRQNLTHDVCRYVVSYMWRCGGIQLCPLLQACSSATLSVASGWRRERTVEVTRDAAAARGKLGICWRQSSDAYRRAACAVGVSAVLHVCAEALAHTRTRRERTVGSRSRGYCRVFFAWGLKRFARGAYRRGTDIRKQRLLYFFPLKTRYIFLL